MQSGAAPRRWVSFVGAAVLAALGLALLSQAADAPKDPAAATALPAMPPREGPQGQPPRIDKPLLAWWSFDEEFTIECEDAGPGKFQAAPANARRPGYTRAPGVYGNALVFSGQHAVRAPKMTDLGTLERIGFSAWVRPSAMERYNEIFRKEDGENRLLFSFQEHATILSLGLNINGYIECDARIDPKTVMDGNWHHAAASFDGKTMRVYLDGREVGSMERPGKIAASPAAAGFIASSHGGECLQGGLDDLRIYREPLTAQEVVALYQDGVKALQEAAIARLKAKPALAAALPQLLVEEDTFAKTIARIRRNIHDKKIHLNAELADLVLQRVRAKWPGEMGRFGELAGDVRQYLAAPGNRFNLQATTRAMEMATEYLPLTDNQWKRQSPEQRAHWQQVDALRKTFESLRDRGDQTQFDPAWVEIVFEAAKYIQVRPYQREAVAPYRTPETPPTVALAPEKAQETLQRDWLHQAGNKPTPQRIRDEIAWARQLAAKIKAAADRPVEFAKDLAELDRLQKLADAATADDKDLYFQVRQVKRRIMLANPVIDFDKVLFVDMPFPAGSEWPHETRHRLGYMAVPGGKLVILQGLSPTGQPRQLMPQSPLHGSFWRPDVSWDGTKVLFCFKPHNEKSFHLYEINADGTALRQLTEGIFDDLDPIYLPDDHIAFSTTRGHTYVRCMPPTNAYPLARCDRDGRNIYFISANNEPDYLPSVMNDGRIVYTRWEYTDKPLWRAQGVWTVNPDGTQVNTMWGNQSVWPDLVKDIRAIPNSRRIMVTGSAHHNWFSGSVAIIDPELGFNFPDGLTKVTADMAYPESGNGPVDPVESTDYHASGAYAAYYSPYPLSERDFLVSANRGGKFVLYLMDADGNRELIWEGDNNVFHAIPLRPRKRPPVLIDRVAWPTREQRANPAPGAVYSTNVYYGAPPELAGKVRALRVMTIEHKTYTYWFKRPYASTGPVVSAVQSDGVKQVLGTVPVEADGSVHFSAPAGIPLHFQLLDERGLALQTMRSFANVMPGESRGCLGCHQLHSRTPYLYDSRKTALARPPSPIEPPPWSDTSIGYERYVQPVLDKYCAKCHQGEGKARAKLDLTFRPGGLFGEPYLTIIGRPSWGRPYERPDKPPCGFDIAGTLMVEGYHQRDPVAYKTPEPMTRLSYRSRLIEIASSGKHNNVKVDPVSLSRLAVWIDAMCPYVGRDEISQIDDPEFQGVDWLSIRPRIKTAPTIHRPGPVE